MSQENFRVLIIGSGLGGLSLAQSLRRANIAFEIFERDNTPFDRAQGYRLHLDGDAINTVQEVLTPELLSVFNRTSQWTEPYTSIMDPSGLKVVKRLLTKDDLGVGMWSELNVGATPVHANVDRSVLRQILLAGLKGSLHFSKKLERYESDDDGVTAYFTDGTTATGSVLVGADGVNSTVCRQRAPNNKTMDAGITAIYGRLPIDAVQKFGPKEALEDIFLIASDPRKVFLGLGSVIFPTPPSRAAKEAGIELTGRDSYVVCIVGGRHEFLPENSGTASSDELREMAAGLLTGSGGWPTNAASMIRAGEAESFFSVNMRSSVPVTLPKHPNVTLLGDAIHSMTPSLGRGANLAMRHGALLGRHLKRAAEGKRDLASELAAYEDNMYSYASNVVREAAKVGAARAAQNPLPGQPEA